MHHSGKNPTTTAAAKLRSPFTWILIGLATATIATGGQNSSSSVVEGFAKGALTSSPSVLWEVSWCELDVTDPWRFILIQVPPFPGGSSQIDILGLFDISERTALLKDLQEWPDDLLHHLPARTTSPQSFVSFIIQSPQFPVLAAAYAPTVLKSEPHAPTDSNLTLNVLTRLRPDGVTLDVQIIGSLPEIQSKKRSSYWRIIDISPPPSGSANPFQHPDLMAIESSLRQMYRMPQAANSSIHVSITPPPRTFRMLQAIGRATVLDGQTLMVGSELGSSQKNHYRIFFLTPRLVDPSGNPVRTDVYLSRLHEKARMKP